MMQILKRRGDAILRWLLGAGDYYREQLDQSRDCVPGREESVHTVVNYPSVGISGPLIGRADKATLMCGEENNTYLFLP